MCEAGATSIQAPRFNQERAFDRLRELCAFGPRNHGSEGKSKAEEWIQQTLRDAGAEVTVHSFQHTPKDATEPLSFRNIVARINPKQTRRVLIATHYDTRSTADIDADANRRNEPIMGANDGASGVAVLLEMAMLWKDVPPPVGVDLIFFDGEDFGRGPELDDYFLGSKAWVRDFPDYRAEWGVVLDMVGDADFAIRKERDSLTRAPAVVERLWSAAARVRSNGILDERGGLVYDDHTGFSEKRHPCRSADRLQLQVVSHHGGYTRQVLSREPRTSRPDRHGSHRSSLSHKNEPQKGTKCTKRESNDSCVGAPFVFF